jgi:hypothetical protein
MDGDFRGANAAGNFDFAAVSSHPWVTVQADGSRGSLQVPSTGRLEGVHAMVREYSRRFRMKTVDFRGKIDGPAEVAAQTPEGEEIQVLLLWGSADDEGEWRALGRKRFDAAYSPEDAVYEELMHNLQG